MKRFAERLSRIQPSATVAISTKARQLAAEGKDILSFSMGEPDFDTPEHIKKGAAQAIVDGATRYTAATGTPELKKAICDAAERRRGVKWTPAECAVSVGAKHVLKAGIDYQHVTPRELFSFFITDEDAAEDAGVSAEALAFDRNNPFTFEDAASRDQFSLQNPLAISLPDVFLLPNPLATT